MAADLGIPVAAKPDSQDFCFVPDGDYAAVVARLRPESALPGDIVDLSGRVLGRHEGTIRFTIGQRRGLGISWPQPLYVTGIDAENRRVVVGEKEHLERTELTVHEAVWGAGAPPERALRAACRIRYRHREAPASITPPGAAARSVPAAAPTSAQPPA